MNERQYNIVDCFLKMGASPIKIAKSFKVSLIDVERVRDSGNFNQFNNPDMFFSDLMEGLSRS